MEPKIKQVPAIPVISRRDRLTTPQIPAHSGPAIHSLIDTLKRLGIEPAGNEIIYVYHGCTGDPAQPFDLQICLPVVAVSDVRPDVPVTFTTLAPFRCVAGKYVGSMTGIGPAWMKMCSFIREDGHKPTSESREVYIKWVDFDSAENVTELQQGIA